METERYAEKAREWMVDYSQARARAIAWLGDRYLLARPVPRRSAGRRYGSAFADPRRGENQRAA